MYYVDMLSIHIVMDSDIGLPISEMLGVSLSRYIKSKALSHSFSKLSARADGSNNDGFLMSVHLETLS